MYRVNPGNRRRIDWADSHAEDDASRARIPVMYADVILDSPERRIILDTKYYKDALARGRGTGKLHSNNLYQLLAYLRNRQAKLSDGAKHEGILLYPSVGEDFNEWAMIQGHRIRFATVDLAADSAAIRQRLLQIVGASVQ